MAPARRRHSVGGGGGAPISYDRRRRRQQNFGGGGAAAAAHSSSRFMLIMAPGCPRTKSPRRWSKVLIPYMYFNVNGGLSMWINSWYVATNYNKTWGVPPAHPQSVTEHDAIGWTDVHRKSEKVKVNTLMYGQWALATGLAYCNKTYSYIESCSGFWLYGYN